MKFLSKYKKDKFLWCLFLILIGALFLRFYNLSDWQYLQHDQGRDLIKTSEVLGGERPIPLLGPRASGESLFLGPIFYYFQLIAAFVFGTSPLALVLPDLFFSLCLIPLLYYFLRSFFSRKVSILVVATFAFSFVFTQYSRFAWNPNSIPFWGLLLMLSVFKSQQSKEEYKAGRWLVLAAFSFGIVSQLHFIALLGFPFAVFLFWLFYKPTNIKLKYWTSAASVFLLVNLPLVLNDTIGGGDNWRQFIKALRGGVSEKRGFIESIFKLLEDGSANLTLFITSLNSKELGSFWILAVIVFFDAFCLAFIYWQKRYKNKLILEDIKDNERCFLVLNLCWLLGFLPLYYKLAFDIDNLRFWFPVFIVPFLILALYLKFLFYLAKKIKWLSVFAYSLVFLLLALNLSATWKWYGSLLAQEEIEVLNRSWTSRSFKQDSLETVESQRAISRFIVSDAKKEGRGICVNTPSEFTSVFKYFILREEKFNGFFKKKGVDSDESFNRFKDRCKVYVVDKKSKDDKRILGKLEGDFTLRREFTNGSFSVWSVDKKLR